MKQILLLIIHLILINPIVAQNKIETVVQIGHTAAVKTIAISPDNKYLISGSRDKSIILWDNERQAQIRSFNGHQHTVNSLAWNENNNLFVSGSADKTAKVWDIKTGECIFTTPSFKKYVTAVAFTPDQKAICVGGYDDSARIYEITKGKLLYKFKVNADQGLGTGINVQYSKDGKWLAIGQDNKTVDVYAVNENYTLKYTFKPNEGWCGGCGTYISFSPDSKILVKLAHRDRLTAYNLMTGEIVKTFGPEADDVIGINYHTDGQKITSAFNNKIYTWDTNFNAIDSFIPKQTYGEINEITLANNKPAIYTATNNYSIVRYSNNDSSNYKVYNGTFFTSNSTQKKFNENSYWESHIAKYLKYKNQLFVLDKNDLFLTNKTNKNITLWESQTGQAKHTFKTIQEEITCMDIDKEQKEIIAGDADGNVYFFDLEKGKLIRSFKAHRDPIFSINFSPDKKTFCTSSWDATIRIWNYTTLEREVYLDQGNQSAYNTIYSPDGLYIIAGRLDKNIVLIEPDSKSEVRSFIGHSEAITSICFGKEKYTLLSASKDGSARLWDISNGMMLQKFKVAYGSIYTAVFDPENKKILTAGEDRIIRLWDIKSGKLVKELTGHQSEITDLKFNKEGTLLLSYSIDGTVKCWNYQTKEEFYEHIHFSEKDWMVKTREGYFNGTSDARNLIHFIKGTEVFAPDQFFEKFYRPELIPELYKKQGNTSRHIDMGDLLQKSPPPSIHLKAVKQNPKEAELYIKVIDNGGGVSEINVFHNGKAILLPEEKLILPSGKDSSTYIRHIVPLVNGHNYFKANAFTHDRIEAPSSQEELFSEKAKHDITCHVIAIGIDRYKNPALKLNYARNDADAFVKSLKENTKGLYSHMRFYELYDDKAVSEKIMDSLDHIIQQAKTNDVFIFYYAGHGTMNKENFYLIASDCIHLYDEIELNKKAVSDKDLVAKFKQIKALKQVILLDACQSGGAVQSLATRGAVEEKALAQLARSAGIHIFASAGQKQFAEEIEKLSHGAFTYVLLDAMNGNADGTPADGNVTIYELKSYIEYKLPEILEQYSNRIQYPYTFSIGQDFPFVLN